MDKTDDHDSIVENTVLLKQLIKNFENHLAHHWRITCIALGAGLIGALNMAIGLILISIKGL